MPLREKRSFTARSHDTRHFASFSVLLVEAIKQDFRKPAAVRAPRRRLVCAPVRHGL
jgi:phosphatidylserine decarboxylase